MDELKTGNREAETGKVIGKAKTGETAGKKSENTRKVEVASLAHLRAELERAESESEFRRALMTIAGILIVAAAIAALLVTRFFMLLEVNGRSMMPTLAEKETVVLYQTKDVEVGDVIGFYYGGEVLLKRVIACAGDEIEIDQEGNVFVNGELTEEPYLTEKNLGQCNLEFPYQVPAGMYFVLGDNRAESIDSRTRAIGCVERSQIVGKIVWRVWPLSRMEAVR